MNSLSALPVRAILRALVDAAERWSDADFPPRVRVAGAIAERTGYSLPVVDYALDRLFFSITETALEATISAELGSIDALDRFVARDGRPDAHAAAAGKVCVVSSRTTIGVALVPAIFALCAKCDVLVKDRADTLVAAFFETLAQERDEFAHAARAQTWDHHAADAPPLQEFDVVVAFGGRDALAAMQDRIAHEARFVAYGPRASAGYVTRESLESTAQAVSIAEDAARDLVLYESEGCLSLHALFVETGGRCSPEAFCARFAAAVEKATVEFPPGRRDAAREAGIAHLRDLNAFRAAAGKGAVFSDAAGSYCIVLDPPSGDPPAFLPRTIGVHAVASPDEAVAYLRRHHLPLEAFALSDGRDDVLDAAVAAGAVRLTSFGKLQQPPLSGDHGGRGRIGVFVRWIDKEL